MMVFNTYWMRLTLLLLVLCGVQTSNTKRLKKLESTDNQQKLDVISKDIKEVKTKSSNHPQKAIIAIEIVDPNDNSTQKGRGKKRTIESALGYGYNTNVNDGYQNFFNVKQKPPRYEVYKYSQHDIPAYKGQLKDVPYESYNTGAYHEEGTHHTHQSHHGHDYQTGGGGGGGGHGPGQFEIQKSLQYDLGSTVPVYVPSRKRPANLQHYYQNGATLFSSLDQNGHLGSLSSQVPNQHGPMVPVIIFRVYTNQLTQRGGLHPNIPQGHPYANLNNVDLQSLLAGYVQKHNPQQQPQQQQYYEQSQGGHQEQQPVYYPEQQQQHPQHQHVHSGHSSSLETHENYPDNAHTKVIFHNKNKASKNKQRRPTPQKFKITIPENTYSKVEVQEHTYGPPAPQEEGHGQGALPQYAQEPVEHHQHQQYEQQYYYQQETHPQQEPQQHQHEQYYQQQVEQQTPVQDYQPSVQSVVHYQQTTQTEQHPQQQHAQQQPEQQEVPNPNVHYDAQKYVQLATYSAQQDPEQAQVQVQPQAEAQTQDEQHQQQAFLNYQEQYVQYHQQQQQQQQQQQHQQQQHQHQELPQVEQQQEYYQHQPQTSSQVQYLHSTPEQRTENQDFSLVKHSNDAGRDLHPKVYNYHAHGGHQHRGGQKKKRERKHNLSSRVPLVLAPEVMDTLKSTQ